MEAIERENSGLRGVLPKDYNRPAIDPRKHGELIDLIAGIGLGDEASRSQDLLGRVYEYFLVVEHHQSVRPRRPFFSRRFLGSVEA